MTCCPAEVLDWDWELSWLASLGLCAHVLDWDCALRTVCWTGTGSSAALLLASLGLCAHVVGDETSCVQKGILGFFGLYQGASNHEELHNLMKATVMIRRLKKDVLSQLPVKRRQQVFLDLSEKDVKNVRALFIELETLKIKIDSSDSKEMIDSLRFAYQNIVNKHQSGAASNHVEGSPASHVGPSPPGPSPGSHAGASHPSQSP
ncbi:uncharacterized protein [Miscanthus floridulus]|uniref:uncharacterized protein n=1 Tax=Miscanthus floridulus TaxID=154761 RepID=UPI0034583527